MTRIIFHIDVNSAYLSWTAISLSEKGKTDPIYAPFPPSLAGV